MTKPTTTARQAEPTPGPWVVYRNEIVVREDEEQGFDGKSWTARTHVARTRSVGCAGLHYPFKKEAAANARLIAAAPDLLWAAKSALALLCGDGQDGTLGHHPGNPVPTVLRNAIAKARAEPPA